jgi:hypothetical protein
MKVTIHQPQYLPWLGYFDKIDQADCFVILDTVQFTKHGWQNRNRIKTVAGPKWVTVPVHRRFPETIANVTIDNGVSWARKHLQALISSYQGSPFFAPHRPFFEGLYAARWHRLLDLNLEALRYLAQALGMTTRVLRASSLRASGTATDRLVSICQAVGADTYLAGTGGSGYVEVSRFEAAGIRVCFQDFACPTYAQRFGGFVPDLSVVDLLFNCGPESLPLLRRARRAESEEPRVLKDP